MFFVRKLFKLDATYLCLIRFFIYLWSVYHSHIVIEMQNDKVSPTAVGTQIRRAQKVNNDQVAIDVEMHKDKPLDDEDDDKGGKKSCMLNLGLYC